MWLKNKTLLIVSPHPDDEILGCGGLIKKIKDQNGKVYVIYLTIGDTVEFSSNGNYTNEEQRRAEIDNVSKYMGYDGWRIAFSGNKYHLRLDTIAQNDIITNIEKGHDISIEGLRPTIIATSQFNDYNQDHRSCALGVISACRPSVGNAKSAIEAVWGYEFTANVAWGIGLFGVQNTFIKLNKNELDTKINAMKIYSSQVREPSHTRSLEHIKNLAKIRGAACGSQFAEAFHSYRLVF